MRSKSADNDSTAPKGGSDKANTPFCGLSDEQKARIAELLERLHSTPSVFEDESMAPEVDREALLALARGKLPEEQARVVYRLVYSFKSWCEAHGEVLIEEFRRSK